MTLQDYKSIVVFLANVTTIGQFLSGVFTCKKIVKQNSTRNVQFAPFLGGMSLSFMFLRYAYVKNEFYMLPVCYTGMSLNIGYSLLYAYYHEQKLNMLKQYCKILLGVFTIIVYTFLEDPNRVKYRFGMIITVLMFALISSPFLQLGKVLKTKSSESLPLPFIISGTIVSSVGLLYAVTIDDGFMQFQRGLALTLSAIQLALCVIYSPKYADATKIKKKN